MVSFPPYAASARWYSHWVKLLICGLSPEESAKLTNEKMENSRQFARTVISNGDRELVLSLPVEGGGRQLRDLKKIPELRLSEHDNWRRTHPLALEAAYGRTPFYSHFFPEINKIYNKPEIKSLEVFNLNIHEQTIRCLFSELNIEDLKLFSKKENAVERGKEIAKIINPEHSVLESFFRLGPEAILGIISL